MKHHEEKVTYEKAGNEFSPKNNRIKVEYVYVL